MRLTTPLGGVVDATGEVAEHLMKHGFKPLEQPKPPAKKAAPRKRKTTEK